jgi:polar amino acid transport system substrate-binding protein
MRRSFSLIALLILCAVAIAACGSSNKDTTTSAAATSTAASDKCSKENLTTRTPGVLTVATDSPAFPPYFEDNKPENGKGFESAVAYAIAKQLGFANADVKWVKQPFNGSYAPGPKRFDFDVNQISITPERSKAVDFSAPYFTAPQAIVVPKGSKYAHVTSLADLQHAKFGVQVGTSRRRRRRSSTTPTTS